MSPTVVHKKHFKRNNYKQLLYSYIYIVAFRPCFHNFWVSLFVRICTSPPAGKFVHSYVHPTLQVSSFICEQIRMFQFAVFGHRVDYKKNLKKGRSNIFLENEEKRWEIFQIAWENGSTLFKKKVGWGSWKVRRCSNVRDLARNLRYPFPPPGWGRNP